MDTQPEDNDKEPTPSLVQAKGRKNDFSQELWSWIKSFLFALIIVLFIHQFIFSLATVKGHSMDPTLEDGEWLFVNEIIKYTNAYHAGDVIICRDPDINDSAREFLVKRIVAVAGDTVEVKGGKLYVNGEQKQEPYVDVSVQDGNFGPVIVDKNCYFVMGDNRHHSASKDSRYFGPIPERMVMGRVEAIFWPLGSARRID